MRDLFFKLFEQSHFDTGIKVTAFSLSHFVYLFLIIGGIVLGYFLLRNSTMERKTQVMRILVYLLVISYISDFFVHEFVYADYDEAGNLISGGGLKMDKLPFHICTVLCPLIAFAQFNKRFERVVEPIVALSCLAPLMYIAYPASVGSGEPWCYQTVQTMFFHGILLAWGILYIALGMVKLDIKNIWKSAVALVCITLWAKLGNILLDHNWFFLEEDAFYIGLVENGIIPKWLLMIINPVVFFLAVLALYGIYYLVIHLRAKMAEKKQEA
ncbi:MAG: YwaF family protein [Clostridia bacterium]|nr:YwaF family protein [Clostridia bacterium]